MRISGLLSGRRVLGACVAMVVLGGCRPLAQPPVIETVTEAEPAKVQETNLKDEMRTLWSRSVGGFVREWLVCGVFPNPPRAGGERAGATTDHPVGAGYDVDYLKAMGGEAAARPAAGQAVKRPDGSDAAWRQYVCDRDEVDLKAVFPGQKGDNVVAYAFATIRREEVGKAVLSLGSDDSVKVYLNGELVHDHRVTRAVSKDQDAVPVTLDEGDNALLVKVETVRGGWGLVLRVLSESQASALAGGEIRPQIDPPPPGKPHLLAVRTDAGPARGFLGDQTVRVQIVPPGATATGGPEAKRGEGVRFDTANLPDGPYEVRVARDPPEGHTVFRHLPWYKGDWRKQAGELLDSCDKLPARATEAADLRLRVLGKLVLDRLGGDPRKSTDLAEDAWRDVHGPLMEHREVQLGEAAAVRPHGFLRLAWRDEVDDSPQFARAYLPPDYDPEAAGRTWPMVVVLHGYNPPNPQYIRWWGVTRRHNSIAERHNVIVLEPHGRGNTSYNGIGDADVLRAISLAKETFRVDAGRVYLTGYSMGGGGTWHVGSRHPELFAAIAPIYGGWDYHQRMEEDELVRLTARQRYEMESWSSFAQAESLLTTPVFVNHGDADSLVDVNFSRYAARMLQRWGYNLRYWEHPGGGHGRLGCEDELLRWFLSHRLNRDPRRVRIRSARLESAAAHWVRVEQREDPCAFIHVDARVVDPGTIRLDTSNALEVRLSPGEKLVDHGKPVRVIWNGRDAGSHESADGAITLRAKGYKAAPGMFHKTPRLAGPIDDATTTPFAIVVGTVSEDAEMRRFCRLRAEAARDDWRRWQKVTPRYFLDTEVTDEQIRTYSLLLFGGPADNLVTRKLAQYIALEIKPHWITLGGRVFAASNASLAMICPNPFRAQRYVTITAGNSPAGMYFANRLPGHVDFAIADGRMAEEAHFEDLCVVAGRFDHNWRYNEKYITRGDEVVRAAAAVRKAPSRLTAAVQDERLLLSELLEARASGSFAYMVRDRNWQGRAIRLGRMTYPGGIGVSVWHEPCTVTYDLTGGDWKRLRAVIGIEIDRKPEELQQKQKDGTRVCFVVRGDGKELYRSPTFRWDSGPVEMDVDVAGVEMLELEVANETTWHNAASSVNWAGIRLEK